MEGVERMTRVPQSFHGTPSAYWSEYTLIDGAEPGSLHLLHESGPTVV